MFDPKEIHAYPEWQAEVEELQEALGHAVLLLHGILNGYREAEQKALEFLYGG